MKSTKGKSQWYLDSGCSRHMTGDKDQFISLESKDGGNVTFGDNAKGKIVGIGQVGNPKTLSIHKVLLVDGLKQNLLSISQLCDMGNKVTFYPKNCFVSNLSDDKVIFKGERLENIYIINLNKICNIDHKYLLSISHDTWIWHRRLGHASFDLIDELGSKELVNGLPKLKFNKDKICDACQMGKQTKSSFKLKNRVSTSKPLELIHMDLFGPTRVASLGGMHYAYVLVDDYSRYTWVCFLAHKNDAFDAFKTFAKRVQNEKGFCIISIRSDYGTEFQNELFKSFCNENGISHNYSSPRTPHTTRKNRFRNGK